MDKQFIDEQVSRGQLYWTAEHQKELRKLHPEIIADIVKQTVIATCDEIEKNVKETKFNWDSLCAIRKLKKQCKE